MKISAATLLAAAQAGKVCMFYCSMELNEVCGSDGITYGKFTESFLISELWDCHNFRQNPNLFHVKEIHVN